MNWAATLWLILLLGFLAVEAITVGLFSIWFAAGALLALAANLLGASVLLQATVFLVTSVLLLLALRPFAGKFLTPKLTPTNVDALIGATGRVTGAIDNVAASGQVKLGSMHWTARSADGAPIPQGTLVKVERIEGVKVIVSPVAETAVI